MDRLAKRVEPYGERRGLMKHSIPRHTQMHHTLQEKRTTSNKSWQTNANPCTLALTIVLKLVGVTQNDELISDFVAYP